MIGMRPAQGAADNNMLSAIRFVAERHGDRVRKNSADTIVPPLASAIHQTYSAIASPQATGMFTPQIPMPAIKSHSSWASRTQSSKNEIEKPTHHQSGVRRISTRLLTSSLNEVSVTVGAITGASLGNSFVSTVAM